MDTNNQIALQWGEQSIRARCRSGSVWLHGPNCVAVAGLYGVYGQHVYFASMQYSPKLPNLHFYRKSHTRGILKMALLAHREYWGVLGSMLIKYSLLESEYPQ